MEFKSCISTILRLFQRVNHLAGLRSRTHQTLALQCLDVRSRDYNRSVSILPNLLIFFDLNRMPRWINVAPALGKSAIHGARPIANLRMFEYCHYPTPRTAADSARAQMGRFECDSDRVIVKGDTTGILLNMHATLC